MSFKDVKRYSTLFITNKCKFKLQGDRNFHLQIGIVSVYDTHIFGMRVNWYDFFTMPFDNLYPNFKCRYLFTHQFYFEEFTPHTHLFI